MKALVLSGGGARGAYQVGVLKAVAELALKNQIKSPFQIYTGVSAGAINATYLASGAEDFSRSVRELEKMWSEIAIEKVFRTDAVSLGKIGLQWMGGSIENRSLLDTEPLRHLLKNNLVLSKIENNIENKSLHAVAITGLDYHSSSAITFVQGAPQIPMWARSRRYSEEARLSVEHVMASSAIPLLFPPIALENRWFGDGCIRNQAPLSPALHLGANHLFVIGVRKQSQTADEIRAKAQGYTPSMARLINVILNSVMLDGIELDIERMNRINDFVDKIPKEHQSNLNFKKVEPIWIHPSEDIGALASTMSSKLPRLIRYLLKGLGPLDDAAEIISYLLFDPIFCQKLIQFGYQDGLNQREKIESFLKK